MLSPMPRLAVAVTCGLTAWTAAGLAQKQESGFATSTTAVVVDVVVRDGKGVPVVDLKPSEFELFEDDVRQKIASVQLIAPGRSSVAPAAASRRGPAAAGTRTRQAGERQSAPATTPEPEATASVPTVIALAYHRLSAEGRELAWKAARSYVNGTMAADDYAGVFVVDTGLQTLQPFTTDRAKVAAAIERAARTQTTVYTRQMPLVSLYGDASPDVSPTAGAEKQGRPLNESGFQPRQHGRRDRMREFAERMENAYEEMMRDRNGHLESAALTALVSAMGGLPGRKTVVLFSEGLSVPAAVASKFRAVIDTANRGNVSV
jgi:VWFA-related protein